MSQDIASSGRLPPPPASGWRAWLRSCLPDRRTLLESRWLKPIAPRLLQPQLWRANHEAVARGAAIGLFWAFMSPLAQVVLAVANCIWWRANIPVAIAMTMVTNPFTIGFWLWAAYQSGARILGMPALDFAGQEPGLLDRLAEVGGPTVLGMAMFGVLGGMLGYLLIKLPWKLRLMARRHARSR